MSNHPNRSRVKTAASSPAPIDVLKARQAASHTVQQAANTVFYSHGAWEKWERGDRPMPPIVLWAYTEKTRCLWV